MEVLGLLSALAVLAVVAARYGADSRESSSKGWFGRAVGHEDTVALRKARLRIELEKRGGGIAGSPRYLLWSGAIGDAKSALGDYGFNRNTQRHEAKNVRGIRARGT